MSSALERDRDLFAADQCCLGHADVPAAGCVYLTVAANDGAVPRSVKTLAQFASRLLDGVSRDGRDDDRLTDLAVGRRKLDEHATVDAVDDDGHRAEFVVTGIGRGLRQACDFLLGSFDVFTGLEGHGDHMLSDSEGFGANVFFIRGLARSDFGGPMPWENRTPPADAGGVLVLISGAISSTRDHAQQQCQARHDRAGIQGHRSRW